MTTIEDRLRAAAQAAADTIPAGSAPPLVAPRQFNPLVPFAGFGWLPSGGSRTVNGITSSADQLLLSRGRSPVQLMTYPAGACSRTARTLSCDQPASSPASSAGSGETARIDSQVPELYGRPAYWVTGPTFIGGPAVHTAERFLAFQYAPAGWALLGYPDRADTLRIARALRFGLTTPIRFGAQLRPAPAQWQVAAVEYSEYQPRLKGVDMILSRAGEPGDPALRGFPEIFVTPAGQSPDQGCVAVGQRRWTQVINGYRVSVADGQAVDEATGKQSPDQTLCASDADGLLVRVEVDGRHPPLTAVQVFGRLKLLGPDPVRWTTKPVS